MTLKKEVFEFYISRYVRLTTFVLSMKDPQNLKILGFKKPQGGFFNFIPVSDDLIATRHLWENHGVKVMPGRFMANSNNNYNPGENYLRIALVNDENITENGLNKISKGLQELK